ncbi:class D sortase [Christensenella minuta]|uniref:class D sortase n=1 Tax=Christensenella minuta TaxID=626937 RepID=UPI002157E42E|nr:class D sortase [Christensenella minuta]
MKSKVISIAVVALTIAASIFLMVWQREQKKEETSFPEATATQAPTETPQLGQAPVPDKTPSSEEVFVAPTENPAGKPNSIGPAFSVYINGKTISVAYGIDQKTLNKGPGWQETSALPGQDGMCVIYGHRNRTHLRILETVESGDSITATLPDESQHIYIVTQVQAFEKSDDLMLPMLEGKSIALITCYPFRYSGDAPSKYLVIGQLGAEVAD